MTLADALALADHTSPMPHIAGQALRILRAEIERLHGIKPVLPIELNEADRGEFAKTVAEWQDCELTETPRHTLMRWAEMGLLECEQFEVTKKGLDLLAAFAPVPQSGESHG